MIVLYCYYLLALLLHISLDNQIIKCKLHRQSSLFCILQGIWKMLLSQYLLTSYSNVNVFMEFPTPKMVN